jgi:hypothetical protein
MVPEEEMLAWSSCVLDVAPDQGVVPDMVALTMEAVTFSGTCPILEYLSDRVREAEVSDRVREAEVSDRIKSAKVSDRVKSAEDRMKWIADRVYKVGRRSGTVGCDTAPTETR